MGSLARNPPVPAQLERDHILGNILDNVDSFASQFQEVDVDALKQDVLKPVIDGHFDPEKQIRGFMKTFQYTPTYKEALANIGSATLRTQINAFVNGASSKEAVGSKGFQVAKHPSPCTKHHFSLLDELEKLFLDVTELKIAIHDDLHPQHKHVKNLPIVYEDEQKRKVAEVYSFIPFGNWGQTVKNTPSLTFLPTTVLGVQNIVKHAIANDLRVRCAGYRHSWSSTFSQDNEILISFVNLKEVTTLPDPITILPGDYNAATVSGLKTIELREETSQGRKLCRVGVAVTNEEFRRWAISTNTHALPVDVILVEVTIGGVNGPICHGAGRAHQTVSDYVRRVEYVDCQGTLRNVEDPSLIKAAAGSFGLLGVVTHLTFELDAMTYAVMKPRKVDIGLAIPPIIKEDIPHDLRTDWYDATDAAQQLTQAQADFESRATTDYYSEWFWFTYQRKAWVNTWNTTTSSANSIHEYPNEFQTFLQWIENWLGGVITSNPFFQAIPGYWQAQLLATLGMTALPPTTGEHATPTIITPLPNALHFRRGIQNMRVRDLEFQIPLQSHADNPTRPDFDLVRRAWWDVINLVYADTHSSADPSTPMRLTLELRIMGGSNMLMAPQRGNDLGTASIEVLSIPDAVTDEEWQGFVQKVADTWMAYRDRDGRKLNVRPHWAKEWEGLTLGGMEARQYLKTVAYKDQIQDFKDALEKIGAQAGGWGLGDLKKRFGNEMWDEIVFDV